MPETTQPVFAAACWGLGIGVALGFVIIRGRFCTMGAVADIALMGDHNRLRAWLLAIAVAMICTQGAVLAGVVDLTTTSYVRHEIFTLTAIVGGLMFGFGMVISCGCGARNLAMIGTGDLRALVAIVVLGITAYIGMRGLLAVPRLWANETFSVDTTGLLGTADIPTLVQRVTGLEPDDARLLGTAAISLGLLAFIFVSRDFRHSPRNLIGGTLVGLLVFLGWLATGTFISDDFDEVALESLTFVAPVGESIQYVMLWTGTSISFGVATVAGVIAGGFIASLRREESRIQGFEDAREMGRYMGGGALMGLGGVIAGGCTFGQGISGMSTLGLSSLLAFLSIIAGAFIGVRYLEHGSLGAALRDFFRIQSTE